MPYKDPIKAREYRLAYEREKSKDPAWIARKNGLQRARLAEKPVAVEYRLLHSAKERAKEKGLPFDLVIEDIVVPEVCPLLGVTLVRSKVKGPRAESPSLDRIEPSKGYVKGNVWVVSYRANAIKQDATPEELERMAAAIRARLVTEDVR